MSFIFSSTYKEHTTHCYNQRAQTLTHRNKLLHDHCAFLSSTLTPRAPVTGALCSTRYALFSLTPCNLLCVFVSLFLSFSLGFKIGEEVSVFLFEFWWVWVGVVRVGCWWWRLGRHCCCWWWCCVCEFLRGKGHEEEDLGKESGLSFESATNERMVCSTIQLAL